MHLRVQERTVFPKNYENDCEIQFKFQNSLTWFINVVAVITDEELELTLTFVEEYSRTQYTGSTLATVH